MKDFFTLLFILSFYSLKAQWTTFATISNIDTNSAPYVVDLEIFNNDLFIAGEFDFVDGVYAPKIARFDGTSWHSLPITYEYIYDLKSFQNKLYIAGFTGNLGGQDVSREYVTTWDGQNWEVLLDTAFIDDFLNRPSIRKMEVFKNHLFIGGKILGNKQYPNEYTLAVWDGTKFISDSIDLSGEIWDMEAADSTLGIVGEFTINSSAITGVALFDFTNTQALFPQNLSPLVKGIMHNDNFTHITDLPDNLFKNGTWSSIDILKAASENHIYFDSKILFGRLGNLYLVDTSNLNAQFLLEDSFGFNQILLTKYTDSLIVAPLWPSATGSVNLLMMSLNQLVFLDPVENNHQKFSIYPNPNSGLFTIESTAAQEFEIFNAMGEKSGFKYIKKENSNSIIQIIQPDTGMYFIKNLINGHVKKIIIQ